MRHEKNGNSSLMSHICQKKRPLFSETGAGGKPKKIISLVEISPALLSPHPCEW